MLPVGTPAPDFTLKDQHNQEVRLADLLAHRHVLLVFYPYAFTETCHGELTEIRDNLGSYANSAIQVLTVSVDSVYTHRAWADRLGFTFPLLSDFWPHGAVARAYGVFHEKTGFANRGTFVIDTAGLIRYAEQLPAGQARNQAAWRAALSALPAAPV
jgi:peroxiredoxin